MGLGLFFHNFVHGSDVTIPVTAETYVTTLAPKPLVLDSIKDAAPPVSAAPAAAAPPAAAVPAPAPAASSAPH